MAVVAIAMKSVHLGHYYLEQILECGWRRPSHASSIGGVSVSGFLHCFTHKTIQGWTEFYHSHNRATHCNKCKWKLSEVTGYETI